VRWALPRWTEPGYQTLKSEKRWDEVKISELDQPTKHTRSVNLAPPVEQKHVASIWIDNIVNGLLVGLGSAREMYEF
jgi:hypothetical protein